jgi:hypothetical protein
MSRDVDSYRGPPHDFVGRNLGSRASREAAKRSFERGVRSFFIRLRRAGVTFVGLMALLVGYSIAAGGVGFFMFIAAVFTIVMAAFLVMFFPVRDRAPRDERPARVIDGGTVVRLDRVASQTEDWLVRRCRALPRQAAPALDRIVGRLRELQPSLATLDAGSPLGGEAQRLIGRHLPDLVETYLTLPPSERDFHASSNYELAESLNIVAGQLDDLCERVGCERKLSFDTERRFIETRYKDGEELRPGGRG